MGKFRSLCARPGCNMLPIVFRLLLLLRQLLGLLLTPPQCLGLLIIYYPKHTHYLYTLYTLHACNYNFVYLIFC